MPVFIDLTGKVFERLTVLKRIENDPKGGSRFFCKCACGKTISVDSASLRKHRTQSCGCLRKERLLRAITSHGMYKARVYKIWAGIISRCYNPSLKCYKNYGERGIVVCKRWHKFENFYADMGEPTSSVHQIERKNNNKGYNPDNCKWATRKEQNNNRRDNHMIKFNGQTKTLQQWSDALLFKKHIILFRLRDNWSIERALTTPVRH